MDTAGLLAALSVLLIMCSAYFSACETSISSASKVRLRANAEDGNKKAKKALALIENFDNTLSAVLIGNNIVNIAASSIFTYIAITLFGSGGVGAATAFTTVVVLIFGEILPKTAAKKNADTLSMSVAPSLTVISRLMTPLSFLFSGLKGVIMRPGDDEDKKPSITEEELKYIIEEIQDEGVLEQQESRLAQSALEFDEIRLSQVLTPRVDVVALDIEMSVSQMRDIILEQQFSRIPVYEDNIDNIIGILHERDFLAAFARGGVPDVRKIMKKPEFMPQNLKISHAFSEMQKGKFQIAVVTDQHGGTVGVLSMEDILEELVGEIWDERDEILQLIVPDGDGVYRVSGSAELSDLLDELGMDSDDIESEYNTVGGWVCEVMGKIPQKGEQFKSGRLEVTVDSVDSARVTGVTVKLCD